MFIVFGLLTHRVEAQNTPKKNFSPAEAIPPSPTSYSFTKYGDIPVSMYSGSASFDIPFWTVTGKELVAPVSLSYHSGGIKVQEEASWVGLGWNLSAGGSITRSVRGLADETAEHAYESFSTTGDPANDQNFLKCVFEKHCDAELDLFVFNFCGITGKFVVYRGKAYLLEHKDVTIKVSGGPVVGSSGPFPYYSFEITDSKGTRYLFGETETVEHNFSDVLEKVITNSWLLTGIISANSLDVISLSYSPETIYNTVIGGQSISYSPFDNPSICGSTTSHASTASTTTRSKRLTSIESDGQKVIFKEQETARTDFRSPSESYALESVTIWDKINDKEVKKLKFIYAPGNAGSHLSRRLTLLQVDEVSIDNSQILSHKFFYNGIENLPLKNSFSVDHWGYYNGKSNTSLVPRTLIGLTTTGAEQYAGVADREADPAYNSIGLLSTIVYPTGGSTEIEYESNTYSISRIKLTQRGASVNADANDIGHYSKNTYFEIPSQNSSNNAIRIPFTINLFIPGEGTYVIDGDSTLTFVQLNKIHPNGAEEQILRRFTSQGGELGRYQVEDNLYLQPGSYRLIAHTIHENSLANMSLGWTEPGTEYETIEMPGPGVRIGSITNKPNTPGYPSVRKSYLYTTTSGLPSGKLTGRPLNYLSMAYSQVNQPDHPTTCYDCNYSIISSNSMAAAFPAPDYHIFYPEVWEVVNGFGKTHFTYVLLENEARLRVRRATGNSEVSTQINSYSGVVDKTFGGIVINQTKTFLCTNPRIECTSSVYTLSAAWNYLTNTFEKLFDDNNLPVETQIQYLYSKNHRYVRQTRVSNSDGTFKSSISKYPQDYSESINAIFLARGMTGVTLEEQTWLKRSNRDSVLLSGQLAEYDFAMMKPKKLYQLEIGAPVTALNNESISSGKYTTFVSDTRYKEKISFTYKPTSGQLHEQSQTNNVKYSYVYDYFNMKPITQVTNGSSDQIAYTSFEGDQKGNWNFSGTPVNDATAPTGRKTYVLSAGSITRPLTVGQSYVVAFWYSPGATVQVTGGTQSLSTTTPGLNGWVLSTRVVSGATSLTISGSGQIDELRLHPVGAEMITYTYEPLFGQTSMTDQNYMTTYFEYDNFGRLKAVYDNKRNLLKLYSYHYKDQGEGQITNNYNYVQETSLLVSGMSEGELAQADALKKSVGTNYVDGLGRPMQNVTMQGSPAGLDIVQPFVYDAFGREEKRYLPFTSQTNGWYKPNAEIINSATDDYAGTAADFYNNPVNKIADDNSKPFSKTIFELSPLGRVLKQGSPGEAWQPSLNDNLMDDKTVKKVYSSNGANEVLRYRYNMATGTVGLSNHPVRKYFPSQSLFANKTYDAENQEVIDYVNKENQVICRKVLAKDENGIKSYASTYYVYDDLNNLVIIIPPEAENVFPTSFYNDQKSASFTSNSCPSDALPILHAYIVESDMYASNISQADADQKAQDEINAEGQNYANQQPCIFDTTPNWQPTSTPTVCEFDDDGHATGLNQIEKIDVNIHSASYNQKMWVLEYSFQCASIQNYTFKEVGPSTLQCRRFTLRRTYDDGNDVRFRVKFSWDPLSTGNMYHEIVNYDMHAGVIIFENVEVCKYDVGTTYDVSLVDVISISVHPNWQPTAQTNCISNGGQLTGQLEHEERDINPYSPTYNSTRWINDGPSANCTTLPDWQPTGELRCLRNASGLTTGEQQRREMDMNLYSFTSGQPRWVSDGITTSCQNDPAPVWQATGNTTCVSEAGSLRGRREERDINSHSVTYNQLRMVEDLTVNCSADPLWQSTGNSFCRQDEYSLNTGYNALEERDNNPYSTTYNQLRYSDVFSNECYSTNNYTFSTEQRGPDINCQVVMARKSGNGPVTKLRLRIEYDHITNGVIVTYQDLHFPEPYVEEQICMGGFAATYLSITVSEVF